MAPVASLCTIYKVFLLTYYWSRVLTCPTHPNLAFQHIFAIFSNSSLSLMLSFLTLSLAVWPHTTHLHIFISVTSSFFTWGLVIGSVSIPYSITINFWVFPFMCYGTLLSQRTPDIVLQQLLDVDPYTTIRLPITTRVYLTSTTPCAGCGVRVHWLPLASIETFYSWNRIYIYYVANSTHN